MRDCINLYLIALNNNPKEPWGFWGFAQTWSESQEFKSESEEAGLPWFRCVGEWYGGNFNLAEAAIHAGELTKRKNKKWKPDGTGNGPEFLYVSFSAKGVCVSFLWKIIEKAFFWRKSKNTNSA